MPGAMHRMGVYLGLVEEDEYGSDAYGSDGYGPVQEHATVGARREERRDDYPEPRPVDMSRS